VATSQNGYWANQIGRTKVWAIPGTDRTIRLREGAPGEVLVRFAAWFHRNVEPIDKGIYDDWGYAERTIRGSSTTLSNHASGTAMDLNATRHPLGRRGTFTPAQAAKIRAQLRAYDGVLRWGGDFKNRADEMHVEVVKDVAACEALIRKLNAQQKPKENDMPLTDAEKKWLTSMVAEECNKAVARWVGDVVKVPKADPDYDDKNERVRVATALNRIWARVLASGEAQGQ